MQLEPVKGGSDFIRSRPALGGVLLEFTGFYVVVYIGPETYTVSGRSRNVEIGCLDDMGDAIASIYPWMPMREGAVQSACAALATARDQVLVPVRVVAGNGKWGEHGGLAEFDTWEDLREFMRRSSHTPDVDGGATCHVWGGLWTIVYTPYGGSRDEPLTVEPFSDLSDAKRWAEEVGLRLRVELPECRATASARKKSDENRRLAGRNPKVIIQHGKLIPCGWDMCAIAGADDRDIEPFLFKMGLSDEELADWCAAHGFELVVDWRS